LGFESELQTNPMPFQLDLPWGATLTLLTVRASSIGLLRVGKSSGSYLSRLETEIHEILRHCRRPFVVSNARPRLYVSYFAPCLYSGGSKGQRGPRPLWKVWPSRWPKRPQVKFMTQAYC